MLAGLNLLPSTSESHIVKYNLHFYASLFHSTNHLSSLILPQTCQSYLSILTQCLPIIVLHSLSFKNCLSCNFKRASQCYCDSSKSSRGCRLSFLVLLLTLLVITPRCRVLCSLCHLLLRLWKVSRKSLASRLFLISFNSSRTRPVSRQHAETALQGEQEQGSHFDNAFFDPEDITFDQVPTHVPDSFDWETFDKTYRTPHEQGANVSLERRDLIPTYNASGYGNIHRQVDDQGDESQFSGIFERAVETRNKGQLHAYFWRNTTASPIPPSINSVLEVFPVQHHNNTPRVQHIDEGNAHHGVGGYNAPGYEKKDDMPSYGNASAQHHDVSVKSIDVGSSDIEAHGNTDPACTGGTYDAHHDVETIGSHTSESLNARTPVAQAYVQAVEEPAKKPTPTFAKQSDGGRRKNGNHGQSWYVLVLVNPFPPQWTSNDLYRIC